MSMRQPGIANSRPLEFLGISEFEERIYRWLLVHPNATVPEIAQAQALTPGKTQRLLDSIEAKGLSRHSPEQPRRYTAASPDLALEALLLERQEDLRRARAGIHEIREEAAARQLASEPEPIVELITNREAQRQAYTHMQNTAQHEFLTLVRPPILISRLDLPYEEDQRVQRQTRMRGVSYRGIVDSEFLALPGAVQRVRGEIKAGEELRVFPYLPFKMILSDRRVACIPLKLDQSDGPLLLVRSSALVDALYALFEILWERSAPMAFTRAGALDVGVAASRLPEVAAELVPLLAAGFNDKAIAAELGLSMRTLNRHIAGLMRSLNARSRFQVGWIAALRFCDRDHTSSKSR